MNQGERWSMASKRAGSRGRTDTNQGESWSTHSKKAGDKHEPRGKLDHGFEEGWTQKTCLRNSTLKRNLSSKQNTCLS